MNLSNLEDKTCARKAREKACKRATISFVLLLIGRQSGANFLSQSCNVVMQNQSKAQVKTAVLQFNRLFINEKDIPHCQIF